MVDSKRSAAKTAIERYVESELLDDGTRKEALPDVVAALDEGLMSLLDIVQQLESAICDKTNITRRRNSLGILSEALVESTVMTLNANHCRTLLDFFRSKLSDVQCVEGATRGLLALLQRHGSCMKDGLGSDGLPLAMGIAKQLFEDVRVSAHTQLIRKQVLDIVLLLLEQWSEEVALLGPNLSAGVVSVVDEERDPRNLLVSFTCSAVLMERFDACLTTETVEALWEVLSSYFPITFTPPKDDKYGITREDLLQRFRRATRANVRLAEFVVPFFLEESTDAGGQAVEVQQDALETLALCLRRASEKVARENMSVVFKTVKDQCCRTHTKCTEEFALVWASLLSAACSELIAGMHPGWFDKEILPSLSELAKMAFDPDGTAVGRRGSRKLLQSAAGAHPVLFTKVWALSVVPLKEYPEGPLPPGAVLYMLGLLQEQPVKIRSLLAPRQVVPILERLVTTFQKIMPGKLTDETIEDNDMGEPSTSLLSPAAELIAMLCVLLGAEKSTAAFTVLSEPLPGATNRGDWGQKWHDIILDDPGSISEAFTSSVAKVVQEQQARAIELAPRLLEHTKLWRAAGNQRGPPMPLFRLAAITSLSLAVGSVGDESEASAASIALLTGVVHSAAHIEGSSSSHFVHAAALGALADVLQEALCTAAEATKWVAKHVASMLKLPQTLPSLISCSGERQTILKLIGHFLGTLVVLLDPPEADALRAIVFKHLADTAGDPGNKNLRCIGVVPAILQAGNVKWCDCRIALSAVFCAASQENHVEDLEEMALEALGALVTQCPAEDLADLLQQFQGKWGSLVNGKVNATPREARAAVQCWAVACSSLWRRPSCIAEGTAFLEALLKALEKDTTVAAQLPAAFQVLLPPVLDGCTPVSVLPRIALQRLSMTTLPLLCKRARGAVQGSESGDASLACSVAVLCGLPAKAAVEDFKDDLRWCVLTGLRRTKENLEIKGDPSISKEAAITTVQVLQLLLRAIRGDASWVEEDLHSIISPLLVICGGHPVPLVRLGVLQVLLMLIQTARALLLFVKKPLEQSLQRAVADKSKSVRRVAIGAQNAWVAGSGGEH